MLVWIKRVWFDREKSAGPILRFGLLTARATAEACEPRVDCGQPVSWMTDVRVVTASVEHGRLPGWVSASCG